MCCITLDNALVLLFYIIIYIYCILLLYICLNQLNFYFHVDVMSSVSMLLAEAV